MTQQTKARMKKERRFVGKSTSVVGESKLLNPNAIVHSGKNMIHKIQKKSKYAMALDDKSFSRKRYTVDDDWQ